MSSGSEKADAPIALLPQKGDRLEQDLMIVVCNIGRAGNGAAAVSQDDVDAARDEPADAALVVFAVDDDDGLRVVLHHVDQPALFLFAGIFIAQHQDGVVLLIGVLHQGAGDAGIEVVVELGDQKADLPLFPSGAYDAQPDSAHS